jgi:NAD(P)-dependent dehydrogenase (short-subunit alcohol dehydrogenase family)
MQFALTNCVECSKNGKMEVSHLQGMALALAEAGASIALVDKSDSTATCQAVGKLGKACTNITADLSNKECVADVVSTAVKELGSIDILVNNAGIIRRAPLLEFSEKDWDEVISVNLRTLFFSARQRRGSWLVRAAAAKSSMLPRCFHFREEFSCPPTPPPRVRSWD